MTWIILNAVVSLLSLLLAIYYRGCYLESVDLGARLVGEVILRERVIAKLMLEIERDKNGDQ